MIITWSAPIPSDEVTSYLVRVEPGDLVVKVAGAKLGTTVMDLPNGVTHSVRVSAVTLAGEGPASAAAFATPRLTEAPEVDGLIVRYAQRVPIAETDGAATGSEDVSLVALQVGESIGFGMRTVEMSQAVSEETAERIASELEATPEVLWAEPDYRVSVPDPTPSKQGGKPTTSVRSAEVPGLSPRLASSGISVQTVQSGATWGLDRIDQRGLPLNGSYGYRSNGQGVTAYVIDTGVSPHAEFPGRLAAGYSAFPSLGTVDQDGHGTHVAGTIGGLTYGVAKAVTLVPVRVLDASGSGTTSGVIAGLNWVVSHHAAGAPAVANMSLGGGVSGALDKAVRDVIADGVTVVVAAGNEDQLSCNVSPARVEEAITVNASTSSDGKADFSNYGSCSDLYAPGDWITSAYYTGGSITWSGTSMAAPHAAGAVARLLGTNPGWSPAQAWDAIRAAATAVNFGAGAGDPNLLLFAQEGTERPVVSAVSPSTGSSMGGTAVAITGSGLTAATSVMFGAVAAASFVVVSDSRIDAVSPPGAAGAVAVSVTGPGGTGVRPAAFTYAAPRAPVVSGVSPATGAAAGGTAVVISGTGFTGATGVRFGAVDADLDTLVVVSDTRIEVDSPASPGGAAGAVAVSVTGPGGTGSRPAAFTYAVPGRATGVVVVACRPDSAASAGCRADDLGGSRLKVSWVPPTSTGGSPLSGFSASAWSATSGGVEVGSCSAGPSERSCTIEGLVNGVSYAVDVEAVNQVGDLSVSSPRTSGVPVGVPEQVVGVAVDPAVSGAGAVLSGVLRVSWSRLSSAEAGGLPVARYVATAWSASASGVKVKECTASATQTAAAPLFCDLTGMPIGTEVHVSVVATSVSGLSSASTDRIPGTAVPTQPGAPTRATVVESGSSLRVSWTAPAGDSTAPAGQRVSSYEVSAWDSALGGNVVSTCEVVAASRGAAVATSCLVPDLVNGITYWLDVTATNDEGPSTPSTPRVQGKPRGLAGAAGSVLAVPGFGQARVSWSAPASDGGWPVTSYTVRAFSASTGGAPLAGRSCTAAVPTGATAFTCVVTGLANGTRYWFEVTGTNRLGSSAGSARASAVPAVTVPDAPRSVAASGLDNRVQVSWLAPASSGGSSLTGYEATAWGDAGRADSPLGTCLTTAASAGAKPALVCEITGLSNGDPVFVDVVARNAVGDSASSSEVAGGSRVRVVPVDVPDAPAAPSVDSGLPGELRVSWDEPGDLGGMDLTGYEAIAYTAASGGTVLKTCVAGTSRTCLFTGLVNEVPAWVGVRARNGRGWSAVSERVQGVPQAVLPGSPTQVAVTASSGQVKVSWRAPANNGGSPVTGYVATAFGAVSDGTNLGSCAASTTACTIAGLQNGTDVYVSVVASTLAGPGVPSGPRAKGTPRGVPMAPLAVAAEPARVAGAVIPGSLQVSWAPPLSDGGLAVSTYRASAFTTAGGLVTAGSGCAVSRVGSASVGTSCVISGLRNGVTYFVGVQAVNSGGVSLGSARDEGTPQAVEPGAPRSVQATVVTDPALVAPGNGVVQVTWSAPASDGGSPVTGYAATGFDAEGSALDSCTLAGLPTAGSPCRLDSLEPGVPVFVEVTATNGVGTGPTSAQVTGGSRVMVVPVSLPDAPAPPALVAGNGRLAVSWVEPEQDGGTAVTGYTATAWTAESGGVSTGKTCALVTSVPPGPLSCAISGLANDATYWVSLVARNRIGTSPSSARTAGTPLATVPGVPRSVGASPQRGERTLTTVGPGTVRVSWQAPADNGGSPVTGYVVTAWTAANAGAPEGTCEVSSTAPAAPATACLVTGLDDGKDYWMSVVARNAVGESDPSSRVSAVPRTFPAWPAVSSAAGGNSRITVSWEAGDDGGSPIARFAATAYSAASGGTALSTCSTTPSSLPSAATTCIITGLANDTTYYIGVEAFNALGGSARRPASPAPARTPATTVPDAPGAPTAVVVRPLNGSLVIGWAAPTSNGGGRLAAYTATAWTDQAGVVAAATCTVAAVGTALPATGCTIPAPSAGSGLSLGLTYYVSVTARNSARLSEPSTRVPGTPAVAPDAPASVTATARNGALRISWAAPSVTGGAPVASYTARAWATTPTSGSPRCTTTASSLAGAATTCTIAGLVNGLTYTIDVTATSAAGTSVPSATNAAVPTVVAPDAPTSLVATPADRSLSLAFTPGSNGGAPVANHEYSLDGGATWAVLSPMDASSPITITAQPDGTPLENGIRYSVSIRAVSSMGAGEASSIIEAIPATSPQAPTALVSTPLDRSISLDFTAGADGGAPVTNYQYTVNNGVTWTALSPPAVSSPIVISTLPGGAPLVSGTTYAISIRALNARGPGTPSLSVAGTVLGAPATPTSLVAEAGSDTAIIAFTTPAGTNAPINHEYSLDGARWTALTPPDAASPIAVPLPELRPGYRYSLRLRAVNDRGASAPATVSFNGPRPTVGDEMFGGTIFFSRPWAGSTQYFVVAPPQDAIKAPWCSGAGATTATGSTGTAIGSGYANTAAAANRCSAGAARHAWDLSTGGYQDWFLPSKDELNLLCQYAHEGQVVSATRTCDDTGSLRSGFQGDNHWSSSEQSPSTAWRQYFPNGNQQYYYDFLKTDQFWALPVRTHQYGETTARAPGSPTNLSATVRDGSVTLSFTPPSDGGSPVTGYEYRADNGQWMPVSPARSESPVVIRGLASSRTYALTLRALSALGAGDASAPVSVVVPYPMLTEQASPLLQTWLVNKHNSPVIWPIQGQVDVTTGIQIWGCLVDQGSGTRLIGFSYRVRLLEDGRQIDERTGTAGSSDGQSTRACGTPSAPPPFADPYPGWWTGLPGIGAWAGDSTPALRSGRTYTVVTEVSNNGMSGTTRMSFVATSSASRLPGAPSSMTVAPGNGSVTIGFTEPRNDHGYAIRNYEYSTDGGVTWVARTPASTSSPMTVTDLANGPTYQVRLRAATDGGPGAAHPAVAATLSNLPQQPLAISNQNRSTAADSSIQLTTSGGSGDGAVTFDVAGQGCALSGATLSTSIAPTTCVVTAMKAASLPFASVSSSPATFAFSQVPQAPLTIANSVIAVSAGAPVAMMISGGSGSGAVSFTALGSGCLMSGASLSTSIAPTTCSVTASKAAGGIYSAAVSPTVVFSLSKAEQAPLVMSNSSAEIYAHITVGLSVSGGSGVMNASFNVVSGNGCWISGLTGLRTTVAPTTCMVTASNAANGIYLAATSAPVYFTFEKAPQAQLRVTNTTFGFSGASSVTLSSLGGTTGALSYSVVGAGCSVFEARLSTTIAPTTCAVTAARAASGIYASVTSAPVTFTATAVSQAVTFNTPSSLTILQGPYALTASSNRGLPVSITASTPSTCAVSGMTLQLFALGSCVVTAAQQGSGIYAAASITKTIDITKVPQAISFNPASLLTMLQTPQTLSATTASGLPVSLSTTTPSVCTVAGTTLSLVSAGWCAVTAAQEGNAAYESASVTKTIQIAKESQVLAFAPPSALTMVQTPSTLSATATSGLPVTLTSTTPSVCSVSGTSLALFMAGNCTITATQAGDRDYSEAAVTRSISVSRASQSISFSPALTAVATDEPVTLAANASSGLAVTFATSTPDACVVGGRQLVWIAGGLTCVVTANQAGNEVYSPVAVSRSIVVSKAIQAVTFTFPVTSVTVTDPSESVTAAYSSSGLPVSVSSMTPSVCETTPGGITWISGDADCVLLASQPGDSRYASASANVRIRVNALRQTITLEALPATMTAVQEAINIKASASSGLPVQLSTSTPAVCSVDGGKLTPVAGGTCIVTAAQSGTAIYSAAPSVESSTVITKVATLLSLDPPAGQTTICWPWCSRWITATVTDDSGKPIQGLQVRVRQEYGGSYSGATNSYGTFTSDSTGFVSVWMRFPYSNTTWRVYVTFDGTGKYLPQESMTYIRNNT